MIKVSKIIGVMLLLVLAASNIFAQCSVCRAGAESNVEHGYTAGLGLNSGIIYLLCMPYIIAAIGFYIWYRQRKKNKAKVQLEQSPDY
jgi:hypothetical protein